jgi:hypothetical protein
VLADLAEVAVWTSPDGCWQEHATFLLGTRDGVWHEVGFAAPEAADLIRHLGSLPGFREDRLFQLLGPCAGQVRSLWRRTAPVPPGLIPAQRHAPVERPAPTQRAHSPG